MYQNKGINSKEKKDSDNAPWDLVIKPKTGWFDLHLGDLWRYRDLIMLFVKRDFVTFYKQTILGPLWYIIQPLVTTVIFTIIFGKVAKISTDGVPPFIFYLSGNIAWMYFANCLNTISRTFVSNAGVFGKVFFPRLTVPLSNVIVNMAQFTIQFLLFLGFYLYYYFSGANLHPQPILFLLPLLMLQMALLGIGSGILISAFTTKYRDLLFALTFGVQLWMYATPIVYPLSQIPERFRALYMMNPMAAVIESFRYAFLGVSAIEPIHILQSWMITLLLLFGGIVFFSRIEKSFVDTV